MSAEFWRRLYAKDIMNSCLGFEGNGTVSVEHFVYGFKKGDDISHWKNNNGGIIEAEQIVEDLSVLNTNGDNASDGQDIAPNSETPQCSAKKRSEEAPVVLQVGMAVVDTRNKWPLGRAIKICFLDGLSDSHAMVEEAAREWERCVNLRFEFGHPEWNSDVRISFQPIHALHGIGSSWSGFGTDALTSSYACNMYLDVQYRALTRGTVLHEFGHLLAFDHEHQSPKSIIQWNKTAVAMELRHRTSRFLEDNYFHTFQGPDIECTAFDPNSIMMYGIPARWTLNWQTYHKPTVLSELDKSFAAQQYPFPPPRQPTPPPQQVALPRVWEVACHCGDTLSQPYNFRQRRVCRCQQSVKALCGLQGPCHGVLRAESAQDTEHGRASTSTCYDSVD